MKRFLLIVALPLLFAPGAANATDIVRVAQRTMLHWSSGDRNAANTIYAGAGLSLSFSALEGSDHDWTPVLHLRSANGEQIAAPGAEEFGDAATAHFGIGEIDPSNDTPEVVFTSYTGGAHCCTLVIVLSHASTGWVRAEIGPIDGDPAQEFPRDVDGDGIPEIVARDENFAYAFDAYAFSPRPPVVYQIRQGRTIDASKDSRYAKLFRADMALVKPDCLAHKNGACAAFVADASRLGQRDQAWTIMLRSYDRASNWDLPQGCATQLVHDECPKGKEVTFTKYPDALAWFLDYHGYR